MDYKLTRYPIGSLREIFTVSWPLILGLFSSSLMMFSDRLFLSHYSLNALNASVTGGMAAFLLNIFPQVIAAMSEVFVGRLNGSGELKQIGKSVWQMVWFAVATGPYFWFLSRLLAPLIFYGSPLIESESQYFIINSDYGIFWCIATALMGFYIGIGRSDIAMIVTLIGNIFNAIFDYFFIFGIWIFPEMGVKGAALATGLASLIQALILILVFLSKKNRMIYGTDQFALDIKKCLHSIKIGFPAGMGRFMEISAHLVFLRAVAYSGDMTIVSIVQSVYLLIAFCTEGLSKAVAAIVSNIIGAKEWHLIGKVLRAASLQLLLLFVGLLLVLFIGSEHVVNIFLSHEEKVLLEDSQFMQSILFALSWMCLFFLFDGLSWVLIGQLLAAQDTKFLMIVSTVLNWGIYVIPTVIGVTYFQWGAEEAWMILGISSMINFGILYSRYYSRAWMKPFLISQEELQ